jgi:hypothetical protein
MKQSEVIIHTKVIRKNLSGCKPLIGEIVSDEIKRNNNGGQFQVLVKYEIQPDRFVQRWVAGGNLAKVEW